MKNTDKQHLNHPEHMLILEALTIDLVKNMVNGRM